MNVVFDGLRAERDVIVWDQRGTGHSDPAFCPELNARWREIAVRYELGERLTQRRQAVADCREAMLRQGVDLSQYTTVVTAQDLEDLRRALGFAQWNLMAVSYGTRVALEAMRLAPQGIRSAVLTSPVPPNPPMDGKAAFADVVRRLSRACAAQPDCNAAYPDVEQNLWAGMKELEEKPFVRRLPDGRQDVIEGNRLLQAVREATRSRRSLALVPMIVGEFRRRNESVIAALTRQTSNATAARISRISRGLNLAVGCHDFPTESRPAGKGPASEILDIGVFERNESLCSALHMFRAGPQAPVVSDIPTLLRTGEFDAVTHRSFGPAAARTLRNSQVVETPGAGHGEGMADDCSRTIVRDFVTNPLVQVDTRCLSTIAPLRFVTDVKAIAQ
jgi:pimeloyl-ACP methyl ester carboxylesterase